MKKHKKIKLIAALSMIPIMALLALFFFTGENTEILKTVFSQNLTNEEIQEHLSGFGFRGQFIIAILAMLQVIVAFLPAEPIQVIAGLTYGLWVGVLACTVGVILGNTVIFVLYKIYGDKIHDYFNRALDIDFDSAGNSNKIALVIFILYFLPAIPYGAICFFAATVGMKYHRYIIITTLGAIPSVFIGVGLGHMALALSWILSLAVFAVLVAVLAVIMIKKDFFIGKLNAYLKKSHEGYSSKTVVRKYNPFKLAVIGFGFNLIYGRRVKVKLRREVEKLDHPSIVLCNHGAFIDFMYAGMLIRREMPHFIVARLYFYKKLLGNLIRSLGGFPKSMFVTDTESAMNSIRVIKGGGVLAMMPEARLSTVGKFEDIQENTFAFLKKMGVTVYSIKICGDYLAQPKWGNGIRGGAFVEAELKQLFGREELSALTVEEIKERTCVALDYDEFKWLEAHPEIHYKSKAIAEGLENILTRCPSCGAKYSIKTEGDRLFCEECDLKLRLSDRYQFEGGKPFRNFAEWYEWQRDVIRGEIERADGGAILSSEVELHHASTDGKTLLRLSGRGKCTLSECGLTYTGTEDGEEVERVFPIFDIYRLLFGAGEDFEIYSGRELYYFVPSEKRSAVDWYIVSKLLKEEFSEKT